MSLHPSVDSIIEKISDKEYIVKMKTGEIMRWTEVSKKALGDSDWKDCQCSQCKKTNLLDMNSGER